MRCHVLQHHNGIVHHITNSDGEARQGNHVERASCGIQIDERSNQRHRNRDHNNHGGTPSAQEDKHDQCHKEHGISNGLLQRVDGVQDIFRSVHHHIKFHIWRKIISQRGQHGYHLVGDFHRVSTTLLLHHNHSTFHSVCESLL